MSERSNIIINIIKIIISMGYIYIYSNRILFEYMYIYFLYITFVLNDNIVLFAI